MAHYIYFDCLMNGSNHLAESDARPLRHCPICWHNLYASVVFNVLCRYQNLRRFYEKAGFEEEACWVEKRLRWVSEPWRRAEARAGIAQGRGRVIFSPWVLVARCRSGNERKGAMGPRWGVAKCGRGEVSPGGGTDLSSPKGFGPEARHHPTGLLGRGRRRSSTCVHGGR